jgi:hypothetical protein
VFCFVRIINTTTRAPINTPKAINTIVIRLL